MWSCCLFSLSPFFACNFASYLSDPSQATQESFQQTCFQPNPFNFKIQPPRLETGPNQPPKPKPQADPNPTTELRARARSTISRSIPGPLARWCPSARQWTPWAIWWGSPCRKALCLGEGGRCLGFEERTIELFNKSLWFTGFSWDVFEVIVFFCWDAEEK